MNLAKKQIAHQFSRAAATYDGASELQVEMSDQLIRRIPTDASGVLVDVGCGTGLALEQISRCAQFQLIGLDIAEKMIEAARTRVPTAAFYCADLESMPLEDECADIIFSNAALQWCDLNKAFGEIHRVLRPKGTVFASTFGPATLHQWRSAWESATDETARVHTFDSAATIEQILRMNQFAQIEVDSIHRDLEYDSVDKMFQNIKQLGATNAATDRPTGLLGRRRYERVIEFLESTRGADGKLHLTFECIFLTGRKSA